MITKKRTIQQIVEEQSKRWEMMKSKSKQDRHDEISVITVSREPGSGGKLIAQGIAEKLGFDLFHQEVIHEMAESAQAKKMLMETLDEKGLSVIEDLISSLVYERHLWPDEYLKHLMNVVGTIGKHGRAVIVGRGVNFILQKERTFRIRVIAPLERRIQNVMKEYGSSEEETRRRVLRTESDRRAFIRKYFNTSITDPVNYDLIINTDTMDLDMAVKAVIGALGK
ncbi:MAG: cytidylate kinase-like family protein [Desulfobacterium sp.]|nr:cytidylate kinase-like family protein [Desulfobacterium sp.]